MLCEGLRAGAGTLSLYCKRRLLRVVNNCNKGVIYLHRMLQVRALDQ